MLLRILFRISVLVQPLVCDFICLSPYNTSKVSFNEICMLCLAIFRLAFVHQVREAEAKKPKKGTDIPIPMVRTLPSYDRDYLPVFREQTTYIRGKGMPCRLCQIIEATAQRPRGKSDLHRLQLYFVLCT